MIFTQRLSLRVRLTLLFLLLALTAWCCASLVAWHQTAKQLNTLFDTQQLQFARRLSAMDFNELRLPQPPLTPSRKIKNGHYDDDVMAFTIYSSDGTMVLHDGENGRDIPYNYQQDGFENGYLTTDDDTWRLLWLTTPDNRYRIVVAQEWEYREEMALKIITSQLTPWLIALPLMLLLLIALLSRELRPLKRLTHTLRHRSPESADSLSTKGVPSEVRPLVEALNHLFLRTWEMMTRERRFTSDAAHELRSPLTALKVQTEVAQLCMDDPDARSKALAQLHTGIDRAARLVEQLLTLSRLDSLENLDDVQPVHLADLLQSAVMDIYHPAHQAGVEVGLHIAAQNVTLTGQPLLLSLLVRNLLDNAVRYSPPGSKVYVTLNSRSFMVRDNGPGVSDETLARLGERFYRPPGQDETGSGLGLSIVQRIATLHKMSVTFSHAPEGGFDVQVRW
ncbi:quorum sensing histidine kinase QseC [Superficieibacter sp.]|uniref:quorum sensing histidine kinase QseC n=1 Tax=Superficieibacter sp. TaxID=2303322 RepID=UPI0028A7C602|nr:quorum sensing histidine kinase QseC [Superficieibacter sp.]